MYYIGIDLGTTNSAICSYDGENLSIHRSPEQNDVTPSAIYWDRRGNKYLGLRAYNNAAQDPSNAAVLFKRMMGSSTKIAIVNGNVQLSPEQCSAEILQYLFAYLPEEIRIQQQHGTVITVPAAFNQMQKDATMEAADLAGIGNVALMQEPVAAVMSIMRQRKGNGTFLVYDLGGGTLDVAIAESYEGTVNLLAHGGISMCGGRDFDLAIFEQIIVPWLHENFSLPHGFHKNKDFARLTRMAIWAAERAKVELSQKDSSTLSITENELSSQDLNATEIYIDLNLHRSDYDKLIHSLLEKSLQTAKDTISKAGISSNDIDRIVFVGGPTQYKPLRDTISTELGIAASTAVNPMTAVVEGAALFAESVDWTTKTRTRKSSRDTLLSCEELDVKFDFISRTPKLKARVTARIQLDTSSETEFQIDSLDSGWSSGRVKLADGAVLELPLAKAGENIFKIFIFEKSRGAINLNNDKIIITRTAASIDAIPASHSIGIEAKDKLGGRFILDYLVREGEPLPKRGKKIFRAENTINAGSSDSLKFRLWEGDIQNPIADNRFIGMFEINGFDLDDGSITAGAELICNYEVLDSGNILLDVIVPSISGSFNSGRNFYTRREAQIDYTASEQLIKEELRDIRGRLEEISTSITDPHLSEANERLNEVEYLDNEELDTESSKRALEAIQETKRLLALAKKNNAQEIQRMELSNEISIFNQYAREYARPGECEAFDKLADMAEQAIANKSADFEMYISALGEKSFSVRWRQDWFVVGCFEQQCNSPHLFPDILTYKDL